MGSRFRFRLTTANIGRLILSLLIAFGIWAFVTNERDPDRTRIVDPVEIEPVGLQDQFQIVDSLPSGRVTLKGPESVLSRTVDSQIRASVDMSGITEPDTYELEVDVEAPDGLREVSIEPDTVTVQVDTVVSETYDVTIVEPVNPPPTLTAISVSPSQVRVVGVRQNVEQVDRVEVSVALSGRTESFNFTAQPIPYDINNRPMLDTVRVEPAEVQVAVEFEVRSLSVPVIVMCACTNESGDFEIRQLPGAVAIPSTVRIEGPEGLIAQVRGVPTVPVNIENLEVSGFLPDGAELDDSGLPEGVTLERRSVDVYVEIEQSVQQISEQPVEVINAPPGTRVSLSPETVTYQLQGPAEVLAAIENDPPLVVVDLDGRDVGAHVLAPRVVLPPEVRIINLEPGEVQVTIEALPPPPTPTPQPTPTSEPVITPSSSTLPTRRIAGLKPVANQWLLP